MSVIGVSMRRLESVLESCLGTMPELVVMKDERSLRLGYPRGLLSGKRTLALGLAVVRLSEVSTRSKGRLELIGGLRSWGERISMGWMVSSTSAVTIRLRAGCSTLWSVARLL